MPSPCEAEALSGGTANRGRVFRVGETVHRPGGPHTPAVHRLLRHLERSGFAGAPRALDGGQPGARTEILSYIPGAAATAPLAAWATSDEALVSVGELLHGFHRHAATFDGSQLHWQRAVPRRWRGELVTHNDVNPANVVFDRGRAVALIDFDLAGPATPAWDLAVTACFWVPLRAYRDVDDDRRERRRSRYALLLDAYGADTALRRDVADALVAGTQWIGSIIRDAARVGHPAFGRLWERDRAMYARAGAWLETHRSELTNPARALPVPPGDQP